MMSHVFFDKLLLDVRFFKRSDTSINVLYKNTSSYRLIQVYTGHILVSLEMTVKEVFIRSVHSFQNRGLVRIFSVQKRTVFSLFGIRTKAILNTCEYLLNSHFRTKKDTSRI